MFNRNTFIQHTNNINGNSKTVAGVKAPFSLQEISLMPEDPDKGLSLAKLKSKYVRQAVTRIHAMDPKGHISLDEFGKREHDLVKDAHQTFVEKAGKHHGLEADHPHLDHQLFLSQVGSTLA